MKIATAAEIRKIESETISKYGISETLLMENAARAIADKVKTSADKMPIAILAGTGNNAGDGFAAARLLIAEGFDVTVFHPSDTSHFKGASLANFDILKKLQADLRAFATPYDFSAYGVMVDALFGTGLNRALEGEYKDIIDAANSTTALKIAVDIPSGLIADKCSVSGTVFEADVTVSFTCLKICQTLLPARTFCGNTRIKNISIPQSILQDIKISSLCKGTLPALKKRLPDTHKGSYGHALVIAGSQNMTGAAAITSAACMKIGAGLTTCAYPADISNSFLAQYPEVMGLPVGSGKYFDKITEPVINFINEKATVFSIGNGTGTAPETRAFINEVITNTIKPVIADADALNSLTPAIISAMRERAVLTPHLKEFSRLTGLDVETIKNDPITSARDFACKRGIILVLKSADTIIALPDGRIYISSYGSPSLSKGGSGDVLAGIITGLVAQKYSLEDSALLACFILGRSAAHATAKMHEMTVSASDIINSFGEALNEL